MWHVACRVWVGPSSTVREEGGDVESRRRWSWCCGVLAMRIQVRQQFSNQQVLATPRKTVAMI